LEDIVDRVFTTITPWFGDVIRSKYRTEPGMYRCDLVGSRETNLDLIESKASNCRDKRTCLQLQLHSRLNWNKRKGSFFLNHSRSVVADAASAGKPGATAGPCFPAVVAVWDISISQRGDLMKRFTIHFLLGLFFFTGFALAQNAASPEPTFMAVNFNKAKMTDMSALRKIWFDQAVPRSSPRLVSSRL
jgi:hypothetical protein